MVILAYISFSLLAMQLVNAFLNFIFRQRLRHAEIDDKKGVSVLIPARNEEDNIKLLLKDLFNIKDNITEILVYNDQSTDNTAQAVINLAQQDKRVRLIHPESLPQGWIGKNYACYQLAKNAVGKQYLFLDADVRIFGNVINDTVLYLKERNLALLSIFPVQILKTFGEKISVPIMNYILLTLLPLVFVHRSPFISHSAANGQFMLFDAEKYDKIQPHKIVKNSAAEDISIAKYFKKKKENIACITGDQRIKCRMYNSYKTALYGFSKNIFMFFGNDPALGFVFSFFITLGIIPVVIALPEYILWYIMSTAAILVLYSLTSKQNILQGVLLFPVHLLFIFQVMVKALSIKTNKKYVWKGRDIYLY